MKHLRTIVTLLLAAALVLTLAACGGSPEDSAQKDPVQSVTPTPEENSDNAPECSPTSSTETTPEATLIPTPEAQQPEENTTSQPPADPKAAAEGMVGSDVSALYAAIGYPVSSSYAPSCLGDGEDGELVYDGFTVYTFKDINGAETVQVVL